MEQTGSTAGAAPPPPAPAPALSASAAKRQRRKRNAKARAAGTIHPDYDTAMRVWADQKRVEYSAEMYQLILSDPVVVRNWLYKALIFPVDGVRPNSSELGISIAPVIDLIAGYAIVVYDPNKFYRQ